MKLDGKSNAELEMMQTAICNDPVNRMPPGSFWIYTASARKKLDAIAWAITSNLRRARLAAGESVDDSGYSGRQTNRR